MGLEPHAPAEKKVPRKPGGAAGITVIEDEISQGTDAGQRADRRIVDDRAGALTFHLPQFVLHTAPHASQVVRHAQPVDYPLHSGDLVGTIDAVDRMRRPCY